MDTFVRVKKTLAKALPIPEVMITPQSALIGDLGMDSMGMVEFVLVCEEDFNVEIPDMEVKTCPLNPSNLTASMTVQEIVDFLDGKAKG